MGAPSSRSEFDASRYRTAAAGWLAAAPSTPAFQAKQLAKFRELAPGMRHRHHGP
jgi:NAD(P) transhydrogenase subunit alpha